MFDEEDEDEKRNDANREEVGSGEGKQIKRC